MAHPLPRECQHSLPSPPLQGSRSLYHRSIKLQSLIPDHCTMNMRPSRVVLLKVGSLDHLLYQVHQGSLLNLHIPGPTPDLISLGGREYACLISNPDHASVDKILRTTTPMEEMAQIYLDVIITVLPREITHELLSPSLHAILSALKWMWVLGSRHPGHTKNIGLYLG